MGIPKPYHRAVRAHMPSANAGYSSRAYIRDREYTKNPTNYLRAYLMIQSDFEKLCEYVEPSPEALPAYAYRMHELLMRICIEVEANFKAILNDNICSADDLNMGVYRKIDVSHHLSSYELTLSTWQGPDWVLKPFESWGGTKGFGTGSSPGWYKAYNASKHDRTEAFRQANMQNLIEALAGLLALISSQFRIETFSAGSDLLSIGSGDYHQFEPAIGSLFRINFPDDWPDHEKFDFNWAELRTSADRFGKIDYDKIVVN